MDKAVRFRQNRRRKSPIRKVLHTVNRCSFVAVEDKRDVVGRLRKIAGAAVRQAAEENRKLGLDAVVIRGNQVIKVDEHRKEKVIATLKQRRTYKPGQVFYARKD